MSIKVITAPTTEPITLTEVKSHLRISNAAEDTYLNALIAVARTMVERETRRATITQTLEITLPRFPAARLIKLERPPLISVTSVIYLDEDSVSQTLSADAYTVDIRSVPGRIVLNEDEVWPVTDFVPNAVTIRFVCGFGDAAAVPASLKHAALLLVAHLYKEREPINVGNVATPIPMTFEYLVGPWRVYA